MEFRHPRYQQWKDINKQALGILKKYTCNTIYCVLLSAKGGRPPLPPYVLVFGYSGQSLKNESKSSRHSQRGLPSLHFEFWGFYSVRILQYNKKYKLTNITDMSNGSTTMLCRNMKYSVADMLP